MEAEAQGPTLEEAAPRAPVAQDPKAEGLAAQDPRAGPVVQGLSPVAQDPFPASVGQGRAVAPSGEIHSLNDLDGACHPSLCCWMMLDDPRPLCLA